jgi:hypothetical protein
VDARTSGTPGRTLTIVLRGNPDAAGIVLSSGTVRLSAAGRAPARHGPVTLLDGHRLTAILHGTSGSAQQADVTLLISGDSASGRLRLRAAGPA